MSRNTWYAGIFVLGFAVMSMTAAGDTVFGDVYGEEGSRGFVEGKAWKEKDFVLPAYPDTESPDLAEVDLLLKNYPFRVLIDPASVSIGKDRVVRYTAIIKSRSGATNVIFEGVRCSTGQYRRYAFGGSDGFHPAMNSVWRYIRGGDRGTDAYLKVLYKHFICPAPAPGKTVSLLRRLRKPNPDNFLYGEEE